MTASGRKKSRPLTTSTSCTTSAHNRDRRQDSAVPTTPVPATTRRWPRFLFYAALAAVAFGGAYAVTMLTRAGPRRVWC